MAQDLTGINSLRQALTPYDDVKFELNLNRHPKAHKNKSIVYAENMKLSKDGAVLENEESIVENEVIKDSLEATYLNGYSIIHIIPCNTELVLFVKDNDKNTFDIWRYREKTNKYEEKLALFYNSGIIYNGGKFSGTFTYTSNDSLIIAFCEYDSNNDIMNPMMTINLGTFTKGYIEDYVWISDIGEFNDRELEPYKLPICPEVSLPQITNVNNIKGNSYIGTYYVYIRYKINKYDYTQWFNIGYPIINEYKQDTILHKKVSTNDENKEDGNYEDLIGANKTSAEKTLRTYINQNKDLINNCINLNIVHSIPLLSYKYCQIGFICISKTYTKYFVTDDIILNNIISVSTDVKNLKENVFNINIYENYYNVKNIVNKNNKLYISNYKTKNDVNINTNSIDLELIKLKTIKNDSIKESIIKINNITFDKINLDYQNESSLKVITSTQSGDTDNPYIYNNVDISYVKLPIFLKSNNLEEYLTKKVRVYMNVNGESTQFDTNSENFEIGLTRTKVAEGVDIMGNTILNICAWYQEESNTIVANYTQGINISSGNAMLRYSNIYFTMLDDLDNDLYKFTINEGLIIKDSTNEVILYELNNLDDITITQNINLDDYLYNNEYNYNTLDNYINNNIMTGLCKGEVYDFYIHFIDKYGHITDGYKLKNKDSRFSTFFHEPTSSGVIEKRYDVCFVKTNGNLILVIPKDINIFIDKGNGLEINADDWFVRNLDGTQQLVLSNTKIDDTGVESPSPEYISNINYYNNNIDRLKNIVENLKYLSEDILKDLTYGDIFDYQPTVAWSDTSLEYKDLVRFIPYYNSQNELFFKVPKLSSNEGDIQLGLKVYIGNISNYGDYVSYFISHKKLEKTYVLNGFGNENQLNNIILNNNFESGEIVKVTSISDSYWDIKESKCVLQEDYMNQNNSLYYVNLRNKLAYAEDSQLNRTNRQTTLYLSDITVDITGDVLKDKENISREIYSMNYVEILNLNKNKYINNSSLYRLGNILINTSNVINEGLNGRYTNHLAIKYGNKDDGVINLMSSSGEGSYGDVYLYEIFGFYDDNELGLYLSEPAKNHKVPSKYYNNVSKVYEITGVIGTDIFYEVIKTLNLFNYKISNIYDTWINFYNVFDEDNDYLKEFNRTIYRSAVISDEGRTNNWRWFENDAYKNIEENKGNITNILAIGNYLYVHTEHSLFAFSEDNTLSMNNQNLQVATPDIFDTEYKEVFITKLGYGGLQDKDAWIAGQFGYIWFDSDSKKIFKVYGNSMDIISNDIQEWLDNAHIDKIKFANDIKNNRILILFDVWNYDTDDVIITVSYNILSKTFISFHNYHDWLNSYNTKNNLYYLIIDAQTIAQYNEDNYGMNINNEKNYSVSFIVNPYYREIKYLENIIFKLRQRNIRDINNSFGIIQNYYQFPVEKELLPFQPKYIRVYNDLVDTADIICDSIDEDTGMPKNNVENYQTPYWDLGNWNFSFLRDIEHYPNSDYDIPNARLFGNYFVISFNFGNVNTLIEFENLDVQLTKDKEL